MTWFSKCQAACIALGAALFLAAPASAQLANLKVVTDANPDYSDMESMVRSITSNWKTDAEKMYALFYWDHIARRQTAPMILHGYELTDPIRQFNDYGFTMCSTISGVKCAEWTYMGYPCRFFDISAHTVPDVWYDGAFHHYDNSLSMMYTLADGKTIAAIPDIGRTGSGPETDGKPVQGYIALYHALTGTSPNGYCEGADTERPLSQIVHDFTPWVLKYRYYYYNYDLGHRYILNLRDGEVYSRFYSRQDANSPDAVEVEGRGGEPYKADPAYYTPNHGKDPEAANPRYHIRGNGVRAWTPLLDDAHLIGEVYSMTGAKSNGSSLQVADPGQPAEVIFKVEGGNVITSLKINADLVTPTPDDSASIAISTDDGLQWKDVYKTAAVGDNKAALKFVTDDGLQWKDVYKTAAVGDNKAALKFVKEVNGAYEVLVKVTLNAKTSGKTTLGSISFETITQINAHTQPQLKLGANTVYLGNGEQTESIVFWPELGNNGYKPYVVEEQNIASGVGGGEGAKDEDSDKGPKFQAYTGNFMPEKEGAEGHVVFKIDAPTDITRVTYGGRIYFRDPKGHIDFLHSFDGGKTWQTDLTFNDNKAPWDKIRYVTVKDIPAGTRSVLVKYSLNCTTHETRYCSLFGARMEVDHKLAAPSSEPLEVTFNWQERQKDFTTIKRSHTQLVEKLPFTYKIDVGGFDQPIVDSLTINLKGARGDVKYGYGDGKDVGGEKWVGQWVTYGKDIALGKPYTCPPPNESHSGKDPNHTRLTDGRVGSSYTGGVNLGDALIWMHGVNPEIVVDLGDVQECAAFRIHTNGYPFWDAMKGQMKDTIEVLTSLDGKDYTSRGFIDTNLYWKDVPVNFMSPDDETMCAPNYFMPMEKPVDARYVKYKITNARSLGVTQVQVLEGFKFEPFDLRLALPDPADNGKAPPQPDLSPNAKKWADGELPTTIGKELKNVPDPSDRKKN